MYDTHRDALIKPKRTISPYAKPYPLVTPGDATCPYKTTWNLGYDSGHNTLALGPVRSGATGQWLPPKAPRRTRKNTLRVNRNGARLHGTER